MCCQVVEEFFNYEYDVNDSHVFLKIIHYVHF